ncbi:MAG: 2-dehydropantoate 2-reductase [Pseudomonadota bacterium]
MRICIFGAGAMGGYMGAMLARAGCDLSLVARGAHLHAMKANGLTLHVEGESFTTHPRCSERPEELGVQDAVLITLKMHSLDGALDQLRPLLGPETVVVTAQNGFPWWYFYGQPGPLENRHLDRVDPGGRLWRAIGPERVLGSVLWQAAELTAPGVVTHGFGHRMTIGEPSGEISQRAKAVSATLEAAGIEAPVLEDIRTDIWMKLWGNLCFNPLSVLTRQCLGSLARESESQRVARLMMAESQEVAEALGIRFPITVDQRIARASELIGHPTSMLQDLQADRPLELDGLLGAVIELGRLCGVTTPTLEVVYDLTQARAKHARF